MKQFEKFWACGPNTS